MQSVAVISIVDDDEVARSGCREPATVAFALAEEFLRSPQLRQTSCVISDV